MKIFVSVRAGAKDARVEDLADGKYKVWVCQPAHDGLANKAVITILAKYLNVARSCISLVSGRTSRNKIFEITK